MKFDHHKYTWAKPFGHVRHNWELVGPEGGVHFYVSVVDGHVSGASRKLHTTSIARSLVNHAGMTVQACTQ